MTGKVPGIGDFKILSQQTGIPVEKLKSMSPEELAEVISTKGLTAVDNSQLPKVFSDEPPQETKPKESWFQRTMNKIPKGVRYAAAGALVVGAGVAVAATGGFAAAALPKVGLVAAAMVGASAIFQSCRKDNNNIYVWQNVTVAFSDLVTYIQEGNALQQQVLQQLINHGILLDKIIAYLISQGQQFDDIIDLLNSMNMQLGDIIQNQEDLKPIVQDIQNTAHNIETLTSAQNTLLSQMVTTLISIDANTQLTNEQIAELKDLIHEILAMLGQIDEHNVENYTQFMQQIAQNTQLLNDILDAIHQLDANNQTAFNQLMAQLIGIGGDIQDLLDAVHENTDVLNLILTKLGSINNNIVGMQGFLNNILAELISMHGDMNTNDGQNMQLMLQLIDLVGENNTLLEGLTQQQQAQFAQLMAQIMAIIGNQNNTNVNLETIINLIGQNNQLIVNLTNTVNGWQQQQQQQFNQLMAQIMVMIGNQEGANATLNAILEAIQNATTQGNMNAQQIIALLNNMNGTIQGWQAQQQQQFYDVMAQLMAIVGNQNNANVTLNAILDAVQNCSLTVDEILSVLNDISGKMNFIQAQLQNMQVEDRAFYQAILNKLDGMSLTQQQAYVDIIQRMINIENGQGTQTQQMQVIIDLIQNLNIGGGDVDLQPILDAITALGNNVTNQGTALAALLTQILNKLDSINNKVSVIQTVAGNIYAVAQSTNGVSQQILEILQQLADGLLPCDDDDCCEQIIAILQEILDAILNNDWNHEGIIEDEWDDLLG